MKIFLSFLTPLFLALFFNPNPVLSQGTHDTIRLYLFKEVKEDTVYVSVFGTSIYDISSAQFFIEYDSVNYLVHDLLTYEYPSLGFTGALAAVGKFKSQIGYVWTPSTGTSASVEDYNKLLSFKLTLKNSVSNLCLDFIRIPSSVTEFTNNLIGVIPVVQYGTCANLNFTRIQGKIGTDLTNNCNFQSSSPGLNGAIVRIYNSNNSYETITNSKGEFKKFVEPGTYNIELIQPFGLWQFCAYNPTVDANEALSTIDLAFVATPILSCPSLEVSLINSRLRLCFQNALFINYINNGTIKATNSYIELKLDDRLSIASSTHPYSSLPNNLYKFELGDIEVLDPQTISLQITTTCDVNQLGLSPCMEARIYPDDPCIYPLTWSGADLIMSSSCINNNVEFTIKNIGKGDMNSALNYSIVEDDLMPSGFGTIRLNQNESTTITYPANGKTIRILTDTIPSHPYKVRYSSAFEACGAVGDPSKGFISKFSQGDEDPHYDILCRALLGSYDPNDKQGVPTGIGNDNLILKDNRIDYLIRFQNTGTDTAINVVVIDSLSEYLDIGSLFILGASHPFKWSNEEGSILKFYFDKINLVDSFTNEKLSNGFVQFSIKAKSDLREKEKIYNYADIYFDFNPAIRTNTTLHTILSSFTIVRDPKAKENSILWYPNPTRDYIFVEIPETIIKINLSIYNSSGKEIIHKNLTSGINKIDLKDLIGSGFYYYKLNSQGGNIESGKIIKN